MTGTERAVIAIDGPAGTGKSSVSRRVATALGGNYIDTGAMYRVATLKALRAGASLDDVVMTRMYVTDISRWEDVGRAHAETVGRARPAATMVQVSGLADPAMLVEIEVVAEIPDAAP